MQILIIVGMFAVVWVVFLLPQQRKRKAQVAMLSNLDVGDEVLLTSGIYGRITDFDEGTMFVEIADGLEVKFTRDSVAELIVYEDDWDGSDGEEEDDDAVAEDADEQASESSGD
jgi:preprotein translocase subunit YajC